MKRKVFGSTWQKPSEKIEQFLFACFYLQLLCVTSGCATYLPLESVTALWKCSDAQRPQDSIIDGEAVGLWDPDQKLVVMLSIRKSTHESVCTGTLISDNVILTAAHCVSDVEPEDVTAYFVVNSGCPVNQVRRKPMEVQLMGIHSKFDGSPQSLSDIALLYLKDKAPEEQLRLPIIKTDQKVTNDKILLVGYGITDEQKKDSQVLRRVYKSLKTDITPKDRSLILDQSKNNGGFCRGDSGAPVIGEVYGEPYILGVNSASIGIVPQKECHLFSLVMDAQYFGFWINKNKSLLESANWFSRFVSGDKMLLN